MGDFESYFVQWKEKQYGRAVSLLQWRQRRAHVPGITHIKLQSRVLVIFSASSKTFVRWKITNHFVLLVTSRPPPPSAWVNLEQSCAGVYSTWGTVMPVVSFWRVNAEKMMCAQFCYTILLLYFMYNAYPCQSIQEELWWTYVTILLSYQEIASLHKTLININKGGPWRPFLISHWYQMGARNHEESAIQRKA